MTSNKKEKLDDAIAEAKRFLARAKEARKVVSDKTYRDHFRCVEVAACKRASMDLTRALAELRKPG